MRMPRIGDRISKKSVVFAPIPQCFQWARHSHSSNYDKWGVVTHQKLPKRSSELGGCWNFDWKVIIARGFIIELKYLRNVQWCPTNRFLSKWELYPCLCLIIPRLSSYEWKTEQDSSQFHETLLCWYNATENELCAIQIVGGCLVDLSTPIPYLFFNASEKVLKSVYFHFIIFKRYIGNNSSFNYHDGIKFGKYIGPEYLFLKFSL